MRQIKQTKLVFAIAAAMALLSVVGFLSYDWHAPLSSEIAVTTGPAHPQSFPQLSISQTPLAPPRGEEVPIAAEKGSSKEPASSSLSPECEAALSLRSAVDRHQAFLTYLTHLDITDLPGLYRELRKIQQTGRDLDFEISALVRKWAAADPLGALAFLDAQAAAGKPGNKSEYEQALYGWGSADLQGARAWVASHKGHAQYGSAYLGCVDAAAAINLKTATADVLKSLGPNDPLLAESLSRLANSARGESVGALKKWFDSLPANDPRAIAARTLATSSVAKLLPEEQWNPNGAWLAAQSKKPWRNNRVLVNYAAEFAEVMPKNAMIWVSTTAPDPATGIVHGVTQVVDTWASKDIAGLQNWLRGNPGSPIYAQAVQELSIRLSKSDPKLSHYWAAQIPSGNILPGTGRAP